MERPRPARATDDVIRSSANPTIKYVRSLRQRKARESERAFVVEGFRAIAAGIGAGAMPRVVLVRDGEEASTGDWLGLALPYRIVAASVFDDLADTVTPQGALAVFPLPDLPVPEVDAPLYLVLDQVRDPGNLGTLLRSAAGAGATAVLLSKGTVDPFNPKTVRAAVGAHFRIPIRWLDLDERARVEHQCQTRVVADGSALVTYDEIDWTRAAAVVIGSEALGPGELSASLGTVTARIPLAGGVESLNAGIAGAIFLFEAARQRRRRSDEISANICDSGR
jgi:TrmH family RNA methyltransferase